jgi:uncharacterized membrane protein YdfJ with MMPL/SSD domain/pimeloyl-ACP methyl ester carboxylesterase
MSRTVPHIDSGDSPANGAESRTDGEAATRGPANFTARAARWSAAHRKAAVLGWLAFVIVTFMIGHAAGMETLKSAEVGNGQSRLADQTLAQQFPSQRSGEVVLFESRAGTLASSDYRAAVADLAARLAHTPSVAAIKSPLTPGNQGQIAKNGRAALLSFQITGDPDTAKDRVGPALAATAAVQAAHPRLFIGEFGMASANRAIDKRTAQDFQQAEVTSLPVTLFILVLAFGALVAAGIPLLLGITAVIGALGVTELVSHVLHVNPMINSVILLIGLAVGIDYSLFYLRREREERAKGRTPDEALQVAAATSGRAVLISGFTVIIAMTGMFLMGSQIFTSFGIGTVLVVAIALLGSLTVLPAVLSKLGDRIDRGRIPFLQRRRARDGQSRVWAAIVSTVLRRPLLWGGAALALLVALAIPAFSLHTVDAGAQGVPDSLAVKQVYNRIQKTFPGGSLPAVVVVSAPDVTRPQITAGIAALKQAALATGVMHQPISVDVSASHQAARVMVPLAGKGTDNVSVNALERLRNQVIPATIGKVPGVTVHTTGWAAGTLDMNNSMKSHAPLVFVWVLGLAFLLLLVTFRSIVIPITSIALNLLSVGAAYGVLVLVFQQGHLQSLLGFRSIGGVTDWLPLFLFVVLFGLSMDYHVLILSRIREMHDRGMSTEDAVATGLKTTAGVITSAAVVMVAVFSIFATLELLDFKMMGVGLATAILIDATIVRAVLLPATMKLLGRRNWYLPSWLDWLPHFGAEAAVSYPSSGLTANPRTATPRTEATGLLAATADQTETEAKPQLDHRPPTTHDAPSRWTAGRIAKLTGGGLLALIAVGALASSAYGLWLHTTQRSNGYVMTSSERFATNSYALATRTLHISSAVPSFLYGRDWLGNVRIRGRSENPNRPLFIGIASKADVDRYLAGVAHADVVDVSASLFGTTYRPSYRAQPGGGPAMPPDRASFWAAHVAGRGNQELTWSVKPGRWAVVVMRPDGTRAVSAELAAGARLPGLLWASIGLGVLGLLTLGGGAALIYSGARNRPAPPAGPGTAARPNKARPSDALASAPFAERGLGGREEVRTMSTRHARWLRPSRDLKAKHVGGKVWLLAVPLVIAIVAVGGVGATARPVPSAQRSFGHGVRGASAAHAPGCVPVPNAECGSVRVPLFRSVPSSPTIEVAYVLIRHSDPALRTARGTIVFNPGGPEPVIDSAATWAGYLSNLLRDHDLLLVDPRGTGRSHQLSCGLTALPTTRPAFLLAVERCGRRLGRQARAYTTAAIADDIEAVRAHLGIPKLDLYGVSYGTYLMTVFAQRHPRSVRSIVLSSAYPLRFDMWARENARAVRLAILRVCARSTTGKCDGPQTLRQLARLARRLHTHPILYRLGGERRVLDDTALAGIAYWAATLLTDFNIGQLPAVVRAALQGDNRPLISAARATAPLFSHGSQVGGGSSALALQAAQICNDYPTLWDRRGPVAVRLRQYAARRAQLSQAAFWPFSARAWTSAIIDRGNTCIRWPDRSGPAQRTTGPLPNVPVLVISGDLDANTPSAEGRQAAKQFPHARFLEIPNAGHGAEQEPTGCALSITANFIRNHRVGDTSCLAKIPPLPVS